MAAINFLTDLFMSLGDPLRGKGLVEKRNDMLRNFGLQLCTSDIPAFCTQVKLIYKQVSNFCDPVTLQKEEVTSDRQHLKFSTGNMTRVIPRVTFKR